MMPIVNFNIDEYFIEYSSNNPPEINLSSASKCVGKLVFKPNGSILPPPTNPNGIVTLYYHLEDFQNIIDVLRNEKPVWLSFASITSPVGSGTSYGGIRTGKEPIGEGET
jgi:hypothetical protein